MFDTLIVSVNAIKKAAYRYADSWTASFMVSDEHKVEVTFTPIAESKNCRLDLTRFENEVLDQELREIVAKETQSIRDVLLAQAFSGIALIDPEGESRDFREVVVDEKNEHST